MPYVYTNDYGLVWVDEGSSTDPNVIAHYIATGEVVPGQTGDVHGYGEELKPILNLITGASPPLHDLDTWQPLPPPVPKNIKIKGGYRSGSYMIFPATPQGQADSAAFAASYPDLPVQDIWGPATPENSGYGLVDSRRYFNLDALDSVSLSHLQGELDTEPAAAYHPVAYPVLNSGGFFGSLLRGITSPITSFPDAAAAVGRGEAPVESLIPGYGAYRAFKEGDIVGGFEAIPFIGGPVQFVAGVNEGDIDKIITGGVRTAAAAYALDNYFDGVPTDYTYSVDPIIDPYNVGYTPYVGPPDLASVDWSSYIPSDIGGINWSPDSIIAQDQGPWPTFSPSSQYYNPASASDMADWARNWGQHTAESIPLPFPDPPIGSEEFYVNWLAKHDPDSLIGNDTTGWNPDALAQLQATWAAHGLDVPGNPMPWPSNATWPEGGLPGSEPTTSWWTDVKDRFSWPADPFKSPEITTGGDASFTDPLKGVTTVKELPTVTTGGDSWFTDPLWRPDIPFLGATTIVPSPLGIGLVGGLGAASLLFADDITRALMPDMPNLQLQELKLPPPQRSLFDLSQPLLGHTVPASESGNSPGRIPAMRTPFRFVTEPYIPIARRSPGLFDGKVDIGDLLGWYETGGPLVTGIPVIDAITAPSA